MWDQIVEISIVVIGVSIIGPIVLTIMWLAIGAIVMLVQYAIKRKVFFVPVLVGLASYYLTKDGLLSVLLAGVVFGLLEYQERKYRQPQVVAPTVYPETTYLEAIEPAKVVKKKRAVTKRKKAE